MDNIEKVRTQLLNMMNATKGVLDSRHQATGTKMEASIETLQKEYVRSIVLLKSFEARSVPALLNPNHGTVFSRQMFEFREALAVGLAEE